MQGYPNDSTAPLPPPTPHFTCHGCLVKNLYMTLGLPIVPRQKLQIPATPFPVSPGLL